MYEWTQTPRTVIIKIPIAYKLKASNMISQITENYVKINIPDMKLIKNIDLFSEIDIETSKIIIEDKFIVIYLDKIKEEKWPNLEYKSNKDEMKIRRKFAEDKYNLKMKDLEELAIQQKKDNEKYVIDKSLKIDDEKHKIIKDKKMEERRTAETDLYNFIKNTDNIKELPEVDTVQNNIILKPEISNLIEKKEDTNLIDNEIFEHDQIKDIIKETEVRQSANIKVNLTEKMFPHYAARESLTKEPPYPKSKKYVPEKNYVLVFNFS